MMRAPALLLVAAVIGCDSMNPGTVIPLDDDLDTLRVVTVLDDGFPIVAEWYECVPVGAPCGTYNEVRAGKGIRPWQPPAILDTLFIDETYFWRHALQFRPGVDDTLRVVFLRHEGRREIRLRWSNEIDHWPFPIQFHAGCRRRVLQGSFDPDTWSMLWAWCESHRSVPVIAGTQGVVGSPRYDSERC
ncbi:MAG: hypothetical protein OXH66_08870 [Gemmatimonadetes bacterium]|nr:hypothetical protein [Gemmatimonadota bacterium]